VNAPLLSAIIITRDEERDLPACLESLKGLAGEVIVVDSHSADRTREIAAAAGARVFERDWPGYGPQKAFALGQASGAWVINLDADERVTPELAREIKALLAGRPEANGYELPFRNFFLGRRLRFGRGARESHLRLFRRDQASYPERKVHEGVEVRPPVGRLRGAVEHHSYRDFSEYLKKCDEYTAIIAARKRAAGGVFRPWMNLRLPWEFFLRYVLKAGFLDGSAGFAYAALSAYYAWLKHARLLEPTGEHR
jgi:glycosyltransferase involved in cell wall biosynthesis